MNKDELIDYNEQKATQAKRAGAVVSSDGEAALVPEYKQPASNLPAQVSQATMLGENQARAGNIGPGDSNAPSLAGTTVEESDNEV